MVETSPCQKAAELFRRVAPDLQPDVGEHFEGMSLRLESFPDQVDLHSAAARDLCKEIDAALPFFAGIIASSIGSSENEDVFQALTGSFLDTAGFRSAVRGQNLRQEARDVGLALSKLRGDLRDGEKQ